MRLLNCKEVYGLPSVLAVKNPPAIQETQVGSLEGMATHSSILTWKI